MMNSSLLYYYDKDNTIILKSLNKHTI